MKMIKKIRLIRYHRRNIKRMKQHIFNHQGEDINLHKRRMFLVDINLKAIFKIKTSNRFGDLKKLSYLCVTNGEGLISTE